MGFLIILVPVLIVIFSLNIHLKKKDKKSIPEKFAIPVSLFIIMCYIAYELKMSFLTVVIIFFFGLLIGSLIESYSKK